MQFWKVLKRKIKNLLKLIYDILISNLTRLRKQLFTVKNLEIINAEKLFKTYQS
jgi:hypothetical protein